jgi:predicted ATP-grasp superfamily ATP-dependent carboligase
LAVATSKPRTLALAAELGIATPQSIPVTNFSDLRAALDVVGYPAVMKPVESWVRDESGAGTRLSAELVQTPDEATRALEQMLLAGGYPLVQSWLPGSREAVSLFFAQGRFWARFAQVSHREWPTLGGTSVLCESIPLREDITASSERLVEAMGLEGCSMVEFRRDREGRPVLMEVNPRMGATVALAVHAGVDLPGLLYAWGTGRPLLPAAGYRVGQRLRWIAGDMWYVNTVLQQQPNPEFPRRRAAIQAVLTDFVARPSRFDVISLLDPWPGIVEMQETLQLHAWPHLRRMVGK